MVLHDGSEMLPLLLSVWYSLREYVIVCDQAEIASAGVPFKAEMWKGDCTAHVLFLPQSVFY